MKLTYVKLNIVNSTPFYFSRGIYNTIEILSSLTSLSLRPFPLSARERLGASLVTDQYKTLATQLKVRNIDFYLKLTVARKLVVIRYYTISLSRKKRSA